MPAGAVRRTRGAAAVSAPEREELSAEFEISATAISAVVTFAPDQHAHRHRSVYALHRLFTFCALRRVERRIWSESWYHDVHECILVLYAWGDNASPAHLDEIRHRRFSKVHTALPQAKARTYALADSGVNRLLG